MEKCCAIDIHIVMGNFMGDDQTQHMLPTTSTRDRYLHELQYALPDAAADVAGFQRVHAALIDFLELELQMRTGGRQDTGVCVHHLRTRSLDSHIAQRA